ncbi:MAG: L,D-transpeptidase family protein [Chloroflexi bacterium]|nr:L,D-transpeptidase family protein [Chloroflexota bacterium]
MSDQPLSQAKKLIRNGRTIEARRVLQRALKIDPDNAQAWTLLAEISSPHARKDYLQRAAQLDSPSPAAPADAAALALPASPWIATSWLLLRAILLVGLFISTVAAVMWWGSDRFFPTPTPAPRAVAKGGSLLKATLTHTPTNTPTNTPTITPTFTPTYTPTFTSTPIPTDTPTITPTFTPSLTFTPRPTNTPRPPTNTRAPLPTLPTVFGGGADGERWIDVNLSKQQVVAYQGTSALASFIVSTGTWRTPTVTGKYNIYVKYVAADMSGPGYYLPKVPYVMYFYQGYGLHGTYWHNNFGTPMSHGCVNLRVADSAWLFNFASVGTLVNVHY